MIFANFFEDFFSNKVDQIFFLSIGAVILAIIILLIVSKIVAAVRTKQYKENSTLKNETQVADANESKTEDTKEEIKPEEKVEEKAAEEPVAETAEEPVEEPVEEAQEAEAEDEEIEEEVVYVDENGNEIEAPAETDNVKIETIEEEIVEVPVEETTEEPVEEAQEETAEESVEEAQEETTEEPVEETQEETAEEPVEEVQEETTEEPVEEAQEETAEEPVEEAQEETAEEPVEEAHEERTEEPGTFAWAHKLFEMDRAAIEGADALVVLYYGNYSDTGTAWECGYAYAKGKPIILVHVDDNADSNLMMHCGCRANISLQDLKDYDFSIMPGSEYTGKMF